MSFTTISTFNSIFFNNSLNLKPVLVKLNVSNTSGIITFNINMTKTTFAPDTYIMNITDSLGIDISTSVYTYTITQTNIIIVSTSSSTGLQQNTLYKVQIRAFYNSLGKDYYSNVFPCAYCLPPTLNSYNSTFSNNMISFVINSTQLTPNPAGYLAVVKDPSGTILQSRYGITFTSGIITITASSSSGLLANINYTINLAAVYGGIGTSEPSNSIICKFNLTAPTLNSYITTLNNNIITFTINITPFTPAPTSYTGLITDPSGTISQLRYGITFTTTTIVITATSSTGFLANINYTVKLAAVYGTLGTSAYSNNQICNFIPQPPILQTPSLSIDSNSIITFTINITPLTPAPTSYTGLITDPSGTISQLRYGITFTTTTIEITATSSTGFLAKINYTVKLAAIYGTLGTSAYSNQITCNYDTFNNNTWSIITSSISPLPPYFGGGGYSKGGVGVSNDRKYIIAPANDGTQNTKNGVYITNNSGSSWTKVSTGVIHTNLQGAVSSCCSITGQYMFVALGNEYLYYSSNYGVSFNYSPLAKHYTVVSCSSDGSIVIIGGGTDGIFYSNNYGQTITNITPAGVTGQYGWLDAQVSPDGSFVVAGLFAGSVYYSSTGNINSNTWTLKTNMNPAGLSGLQSLSVTNDGTTLIGFISSVYLGNIKGVVNASLIPNLTNYYYYNTSMSDNGYTMVYYYSYTSNSINYMGAKYSVNKGNSWSNISATLPTTNVSTNITVSRDGKFMVYSSNNIYISG